MNHDIFISYSSRDQKVVEALSHYLEENRVRCFVAYRDIPKGKVWAAAIAEAIESCKMMIVLFSEHFNKSDQVDREIELCCADRKPILTYRISDTEFAPAKKYYLQNLNWIDAYPSPEEKFCVLLESVCRLIDVDTKVVNQPEPLTPKNGVLTESQSTMTLRVKSNIDCRMMKFGELVATLKANCFTAIGLKRGRYMFDFVSSVDSSCSISKEYRVDLQDLEDFMLVEFPAVKPDKIINSRDLSAKKKLEPKIENLTPVQRLEFEWCIPNAKLQAIKIFKEAFDISLAEARNHVDVIFDEYKKGR